MGDTALFRYCAIRILNPVFSWSFLLLMHTLDIKYTLQQFELYLPTMVSPYSPLTISLFVYSRTCTIFKKLNKSMPPIFLPKINNTLVTHLKQFFVSSFRFASNFLSLKFQVFKFLLGQKLTVLGIC